MNSTRFFDFSGSAPLIDVDPHQRVVLLSAVAVLLLTDRAGDRVTTAQAIAAHQRVGDVDVVGAGEIAARANEPRVLVFDRINDSGDRDEDVVLAQRRFDVGVAGTATAAATAFAVTAATIAIAPTSSSAELIVVVRTVVLAVLVVVALVVVLLAVLATLTATTLGIATLGIATLGMLPPWELPPGELPPWELPPWELPPPFP